MALESHDNAMMLIFKLPLLLKLTNMFKV